MKRFARLLPAFLIGIASLLAAPVASAMLPDNGWYWNPAESGRGFNIEIQDNALFMSAFVYRPDGTAAWYVGGGPMSSDRAWSGDLYETANGQCIGCSHRAPDLILSGRASITFTSERTASISLLGGTVSVERQDWSGYGARSRDALFGEWSTTDGDPAFPVYFGDRITLHSPQTGSSGPFAGGNRTGSSSRLAVGLYSASRRDYSMLIDSSSSYYTFYVFTLNTLNRIEGQSWTYRKGESPVGGGMYFVGHRTKSYARVRGLDAPGVRKEIGHDPVQEAIDAARAVRSSGKRGPSAAPDGFDSPWVARAAAELEATLAAMRR